MLYTEDEVELRIRLLRLEKECQVFSSGCFSRDFVRNLLM